MKAVYIEEFGGPEVLKYGDLPDPSAGPGQIVVDAHAASVNAADWKVRTGQHGHTVFPLIPGRDFSGVVSALGAGVDDLRIGDDVLVSWRRGGKAPMRKKSSLAPPLWRRSRTICRMSTQRLWPSPVSLPCALSKIR